MVRSKSMFSNREANEHINQIDQTKTGEQAQVILYKLQTLKDKISALTHDCEELRKLISNERLSTPVRPPEKPRRPSLEKKVAFCSECGDAIQANQGVILKDCTGTEQRHYHMKCFQILLK